MSTRRRIRHRDLLRRAGREEDGIIMPLTMMVLAVALILIAAAAGSATFSNDSANQDRSAKRAQQAADAGIAVALDRMNRLDVTRGAGSVPTPLCVALEPDGTLSLTTGTYGDWCPAVVEQLGNGVSYSYRVQPILQDVSETTVRWSVVSRGTTRGVTRRAIVDATALTGQPLIGDYSIISLLDLNLHNSATVLGNTRSNGNVNLNNTATICPGVATAGPGKEFTYSNGATSSQVCNPTTTDTPATLSPVNQADAPTLNDNARICGLDPCSRKGVSYDSSTRRLSLSNGSVTLGGGIYSFCQIETHGNSQLSVALGATVKIYIDAPENCPGQPADSNVGGIMFSNQTSVTNPNNDPVNLQMYVVGSPTLGVCSSLPLPSPNRCGVVLGNNNTSWFMLYAPYSAVDINNRIDLHGAVAAKQIAMSNNSKISYEPSVAGVVTTSIFPLFKVQGYRECTPNDGTGVDPAEGC